MHVPFYYWIIGGVCLFFILLFLLRKHLIFLKRIKGVEKRQQFWLQHRNTLAGNFVMTYTEPIEDTYVLDKDDELLGRGGYGIVVLGVHKYSNIKYAIKFMNKGVLEKKNSGINRLQREYKLLKDIDHANIVRLFAVYDSVQEVGFVMELCSGGHLGSWLESIKYEPMQIPAEHTVRSIMRQLLSAVAHMHMRGICHRDIKLQNILRENTQHNAQIKLCDFGLGTRFIGALPLKTHCGTLYSTAPEVIRESYDQRCDIWSCGVVAFTLLCGRKPFEALVMRAAGRDAGGKSSVTANILMGRFHFKNKFWQRRSDKCKEFVKLMMTQDYRHRWYAQEALDHSWCQEVESAIDVESLQKDFTDIEGGRTSRTMASDDTPDPLHPSSSKKQQDLQPLLANMKRQAGSSVLHQASLMAVAYNMPQSQTTDKRRQIFQAFDEDNNGSLSRQEFQKAFKEFGMLNFRENQKSRNGNEGGVKDMESTEIDSSQHDEEILNLSEMDIDKVFDAVDVNGDNQISFTEFLAATLDPRDIDPMAINTAFGILDVDKKGYITADDMERVLAVTATARGRRRNSQSSFGNERGAPCGSPISSVKAEGGAGKGAPIIRRHHSFTMGVKGKSLYKYKRSSNHLSPVNSAVNGESDSTNTNNYSNMNCPSDEKEDKGQEEMSTRVGDSAVKEVSGDDNNADKDDDVEKQLPKKDSPSLDQRPRLHRARSLSSMTISDFLRRPSLLARNSQLEKLILEKKNASSGFSFLKSLRSSKSATVAPILVEEGEYSIEHKNGEDKNKERGEYLYHADLQADDDADHSDEVDKPTEHPLLSAGPSSNGNPAPRKLSLRRENSNDENNLMEIDDRTYDQIKRAIKMCDRNNTGVVSYTDFLLAMTGDNYDDTNTNSVPTSCSGSVRSIATSRRNSKTTVGSSTDFVLPSKSTSEDEMV